jgi:RNase P/RNase MRP subunit p29
MMQRQEVMWIRVELLLQLVVILPQQQQQVTKEGRACVVEASSGDFVLVDGSPLSLSNDPQRSKFKTKFKVPKRSNNFEF